jgi:hypothetical protein
LSVLVGQHRRLFRRKETVALTALLQVWLLSVEVEVAASMGETAGQGVALQPARSRSQMSGQGPLGKGTLAGKQQTRTSPVNVTVEVVVVLMRSEVTRQAHPPQVRAERAKRQASAEPLRPMQAAAVAALRADQAVRTGQAALAVLVVVVRAVTVRTPARRRTVLPERQTLALAAEVRDLTIRTRRRVTEGQAAPASSSSAIGRLDVYGTHR